MSRLTRGALTVVAGGLCAGLVGGVALGSFATGGHKALDSELLQFVDQVGNPDAAFAATPVEMVYAAYDPASAPPAVEEIKCKGCGPGIAARMNQPYFFGYDDRAVSQWLNYRPMPPLTSDALEAEVAPAAQPTPTTQSPAPPPVTGSTGPQAMTQQVSPNADVRMASAAGDG